MGVSCYGHVLFSMYANLTVARKQVPEHVIMLKEIFDKQFKTAFSESAHRCSLLLQNLQNKR